MKRIYDDISDKNSTLSSKVLKSNNNYNIDLNSGCKHIKITYQPQINSTLKDIHKIEQLYNSDTSNPKLNFNCEDIPIFSIPQNSIDLTFNIDNINEPAKFYPFQLDSFQKESINCLEKKESLLVAAHTSAGKTVIAEYAIAMALKNKQRIIYTSPIKALSNQKYREFSKEFDNDVGLMTGDNIISPNASCLVMTTEILRNMLFKGSEVMREVSIVIFDEVHYMRDYERGLVWEESIILLPATITLVFLSATISNAVEFVEWVSWLKRKPCHLISTSVRPTPLEHYLFPLGGSGLYLIKKGDSNFNYDRYETAITSVDTSIKSNKSDFHRLLNLLTLQNYNPAIIFSFSRAECELFAIQVKDVCMTTTHEQMAIADICSNALSILSDEDRLLSPIVSLIPLLKNGIGVHHSGLIPILKELVEILFSEGLVKILFATETFAMGVNSPAKTVVFTTLTKFDGNSRRLMSSSEYIQMSGRAGRRGLDEKGICIIMADDCIPVEQVSNTVSSISAPLLSQFRLTYHTILNLLRLARADVDVDDPKSILEQSFFFFQQFHLIPTLDDSILATKLKIELFNSNIPQDLTNDVEQYSKLLNHYEVLKNNLNEIVSKCPEIILPFLTPGRVVSIFNSIDQSKIINTVEFKSNKLWSFGIIINVRQRYNSLDGIVVDVLLPCKLVSGVNGKIPSPPSIIVEGSKKTYAKSTKYEIVTFSLEMIKDITQIRIFLFDHMDLDNDQGRVLLYKELEDCISKLSNSLPSIDLFDPILYSYLFQSSNSTELLSIYNKICNTSLPFLPLKFENYISANKNNLLNILIQASEVAYQLNSIGSIRNNPNLMNWVDSLRIREGLSTKLSNLKNRRLHVASQSNFEKEFKARLQVLQKFDHITSEGILLPKGKVASEIEAIDELLITELIFNGFFNNLTVGQVAASISTMLQIEFVKDAPILSEDMTILFNKIQEFASNVADMSISLTMNIDKIKYVSSFKSTLMPLLNSWCEGESFSKVCNMAQVFEGTLIRLIRRMDEVLRQLVLAAISIGNFELKNLFENTAASLKRGLPFASSLYV